MENVIRAVLWFSVAAFVVSLLVASVLAVKAGRVDSALLKLLFCATFSAGLATMLIWRFKKGGRAGAAIGCIAHPILWAMFLCELSPAKIPSLAGLWHVTSVSLFMTGWLTIPAGGILGWWLVRHA